MGEPTLLELYAAELMRSQERDASRGRPKSASGGSWGEKVWTPSDISDFKHRVDSLRAEYRGVIRLNWASSDEHIANILYQNRYRHKIPEELWEYMVLKVDYHRGRLGWEDYLQRELWGTYYEKRLCLCGSRHIDLSMYDR